MKPINTWAIAVAVILIFGYTDARIAKRQSDDEDASGIAGMITGASDFSKDIPVVGEYLAGAFDSVGGAYQGAQDATDGAIGRLLGGAFPCTVSLEAGIVCSGDTVNSKLGDLVQTLLDPIPGLILPEFAKSAIILLLNLFAEPALDVLFGGVPLPNTVAASSK